MDKKKILICEDDESILDILQMVLEHSGFIAVKSTRCIGLESLIEGEKPDLLILDLWMPDMNGDIALEQIRKLPSTKNLPVIMMSASHEGKKIAQAAGASAFVAKPFDVDDLVKTVRKYLN